MKSVAKRQEASERASERFGRESDRIKPSEEARRVFFLIFSPLFSSSKTIVNESLKINERHRHGGSVGRGR